MDHRRFVDQAFIGEIEIEAQYCLASADAVDASLRTSDLGATFQALHSLLAHAAMISKFLWPVVRKPPEKVDRMKQRAERLRTALGLSEATLATLGDRDLRNSLEHFDERLDDWAAQAPRGLIDRNIGAPNAFPGFDSAWKLRHYDPASHSYTFGNTALSVRSLVDAAKEVLSRVPAARKHLAGTV